MRAMLLIITLLPFLFGCAGRNSSFFEEVGKDSPKDVTRLYVDAFGNLYPNSGLKSDFEFSDNHDGSLLNAMMEPSSALCSEATMPSDAQDLCKSIPSGNWHNAQTVLWRKAAKSIIADAGVEKGEVDLIFLVHGFNNLAHEARASYSEARKKIARYKTSDQRQHFIEIYWDGFKSDAAPIDAWGKAQAAGPLVGFKLRRLMHELKSGLGIFESQSIRVRFLTHSSGAFVVGATFGDPIAALPLLQHPTDPDYRYFADFRSNFDTTNQNSIASFDNLRIGMLAPATSDWTFVGNNQYEAGFRSAGATVLFSVQPKDKALTKVFLGADFPDSGSTGLGVNSKNHYCSDLKDNSELKNRNINFIGYNFSRSEEEFPGQVQSHDFAVYLKQATEHSSFMDDLFGNAPIDLSSKEKQLCGEYD